MVLKFGRFFCINFLFGLLFLLPYRNISAQSISSYVITSSGSISNSVTLTLNSNIGELLVTTIGTSQIYFTQGFLQNDPHPTSVQETSVVSVQVYPNPFIDRILIKLNDAHNGYVFKLSSMHGDIVSEGVIQPEVYEYYPEFLTISPGCYFLNLCSLVGDYCLSFKIIRL